MNNLQQNWVDGLGLVSAQLLQEQLSNPDLVSGLWAFHLPAEEHLPWIVVEGESSSPNGSPKEMFLGPTLKLVFSRLVACYENSCDVFDNERVKQNGKKMHFHICKLCHTA